MPRFDVNDQRHDSLFRTAAETGEDPENLEHPEGNYGYLDEDFTNAEHDSANGVAANRDEFGVGYCTLEEVDAYYDSVRSTGISINENRD